MFTCQLNPKALQRIARQPSQLVKTLCSFQNEHHVFDRSPRLTLKSIHHSMFNFIHQSRFEALKVFKKQFQMGVSEIDEVAIALALKACKGDLKFGSQLHSLTIRSGLFSYITNPNSLMNMYCKSGQFSHAMLIFEDMENPDTVSYNTVLSGCENGGDALCFAHRMHALGVTFDAVSYTTALSHCTTQEMFIVGSQLHSCVIKSGLEFEVFIGNALVTMYLKWGKIVEAERVFREMPSKDLVSWNTLVGSQLHSCVIKSGLEFEGFIGNALVTMYLKWGKIVEAERLVQFQLVGSKEIWNLVSRYMVLLSRGPTELMFRFEIFNSMTRDFSIEPSAEHYSCVVDMLGRAGRLNEAEQFMSRIPGGPGISALQSLLGSCRTHGNVEMAKRVGEALIALEPEHSGSFVLMSNLYAEKGQWEKVANIRKGMRCRGVKKEVAFSWVDVGSFDDSLNLHGFSSDVKSHPLSEEIYRMVEWLGSEMKHLEEDEDDRYNRFVACGHI
ncbi:PREDICTED: pentatricopeptide repeat-containing protein At4g32430, mitochondrial-like [Ipomoea nil]|uniref:pentatricopeptide repeat-containing protein At4g32430, mitochondrial-like n=1 Tax=Ipomoea nil TaxID=35883 RepID=UPI000901706A|nr:PREDICTED: pentatricopeptide repeat-containing protein At4g32430, mitochondrial-like [Ipomoea nil]